MIIKILGNEVAIDSSNTVANSNLVRIINTGASANLSIINGSTIFANVTISNTETIIVEKDNDQKLQGAGMRAVPVAYKS